MEDEAPLARTGLVLAGELGSGGMATVYAATHPSWGEVAVKLLRDDALKRHRIRFVEEVRVLSRLRHPHIVRVFAAGSDGGRPWIAMERVEGGSLLGWVQRHGPLALEDVVRVGVEALDALTVVHALGIVHRDIKPQNLLVAEDGTVKICDFGVARLDAPERVDLTRTGDRLGTLTYMAPEQRMNPRNAEARSDLYALAATLYAAATGRKPLDLSLAEFQPDLLQRLDPRLREVLGRATRYRPEDRYASAAEMCAALRAVR